MTINRTIETVVRELADMTEIADITDAKVLDLWARYMRAHGLSRSTVKDRLGALRRLGDYLDPETQNARALLTATSGRLVEWQADHECLSPESISVYIGHYVAFYRWCVRPARILTENPTEDLDRPGRKRRFARPILEKDLRYALDVCTDQLVRTWLVLGAYAGLRGIDVAQLETDAVLTDYERPRLRVKGKGGHEDIIDIGEEVVRVLAPYTRSGGTGPMFTDADGKRVRAESVYGSVNDFLHAIGLKYTMHQARHRYGTLLYRLTRDIRYVQRQMRHRSVATTEPYTLVPDDRGERSMQLLDAELAVRPRLRGRPRDPMASLEAMDLQLATQLLAVDETPDLDEPQLTPSPEPLTPQRSAALPPVPVFRAG